MKHKVYQINNLKIRYNSKIGPATHPWKVWTPDGRLWDEFTSLDMAKAFAKRTTDFAKR